MEKRMIQAMQGTMANFRLPRFAQLPDGGLYLEQTAKYINHCLEPLGCVRVTGSMIRNYVKMGLVRNPENKRYYAEHISHLIPITIVKQVLPLGSISTLFPQKDIPMTEYQSYDYFCMELEGALYARFKLGQPPKEPPAQVSGRKEMMRSAIIAFAQVLYLNRCVACIQNPPL